MIRHVYRMIEVRTWDRIGWRGKPLDAIWEIIRLNRRPEAMLQTIGERPGKSLPAVFQDWSNTKAAYRFLSNENVGEDKILECHFAASALRIRATDGPILILRDTTKCSFKRSASEKVRLTKISAERKPKKGRKQKYAICWLPMHANMAITPECPGT